MFPAFLYFSFYLLQLEVHSFNKQKDLVDFCLGSSVYIVTNEPTSKGLRSKHTVVKEIADKFNISSEEVNSYAKILFRSCPSER